MEAVTSYRTPLKSAMLTLGLALGAAGCAHDVEDASSLDSLDELDPEGVFANHLSDAALTHNALITNPDANAAMTTLPLSTASYADAAGHADLRYQLHHEPTREVMSYLVSCALEPGQSVSYTDTLTGATYHWSGEMGLCPSWATGPASTTCQELVTACLLARVNAFGKKIALSTRGEVPGSPPGSSPSALLYPSPTVSTTTYKENGDTLLSFKECEVTTIGVSRNCGWVANQVGTCNPGSTVYIGAGAKPASRCSDPMFPVLGSSSGNTVLRVCEGIRGCNSASTNFIAQSGTSCGTTKPAVEFVCPASGFFSVMSGPQSSGGAGVATPAAHYGAGTVYPAPEQKVFPWQEGAFYGNFFGGSSLHPWLLSGMNKVDVDGNFTPAPSVLGAVFRQAFACTGIYWTNQEAYMKDRVCAGTDTDCAATPVGACHTSVDNTPSCPPTHRCAVLDGAMVPGDGDYDGCAGGARGWINPISVYLNDPSDVISDPDHHATLGSPAAPPAPLCP